MLRTIADAGQDDQTHHDCTRQFANRLRWLRDQRGLSFSGYEALRQWSVREIDAFWQDADSLAPAVPTQLAESSSVG
jgi:rhamnogalacturonyl hydrolase YesR